MNDRRSRLALLAVVLVVAALTLEDAPIAGDGLGYYAWTRSLLLDGDLSFADDYRLGEATSYLHYPTPKGVAGNVFPFGVTLLWSPFFGLARLWTTAWNALAPVSSSVSADGFGPFESLWIRAATLSCGFGCLLLSLRLARRQARVEVWPALGATLGVLLFTPFAWYLFHSPTWPHVPSALLGAIFLAYWSATRPSPQESESRKSRMSRIRGGLIRGDRTFGEWAVLGGLLGIAAMIRPMQVVWAALPAVEALAERRWKPGAWAAFGLAAGVAFSPQWLAWRLIGDGPLGLPAVERSLVPVGETSLSLFQPALWSTLFSPYHGLLWWSPIVLVALAGLVPLGRRDRTLALGLGAVLALQWWANAAVYDWWAGLSFGGRRFVDIAPALVVGLAAALGSRWRRWAAGGVAVCGAWSSLLHLQARSGLDLLYAVPSVELLEGQWEMFRGGGLRWSELFTPASAVLPLGLVLVPWAIGWWIVVQRSENPASGTIAAPSASTRRPPTSRWRPALTGLAALTVAQLFWLGWAGSRTPGIGLEPIHLEEAPPGATKARFFYGPTYLEKASWWLDEGEPEKARLEAAKARRLYAPDDPHLLDFERRFGSRLGSDR